jgi:signal transduction histidine kinase/sugar lactone lactonase YvrE
VTTSGVPAALADVPALAMIRDRQANVWVAGGGRGLLRVTAEEVSVLDADQAGDRPSVSSVFEDREGNIWAGSSRGLVRLRDTVFTTWSTRQGLPSDTVGPVYVDRALRTWLAPADRGLYWLRGGEMHAITGAGLAADVVYSIDGAGDDVWVGRQQGGLTRIRVGARGTAIDRFTQADGLAQNNVYSVRVARDGSVWAGTLSGGVSHFKDGVFHNVTVADGLPSNTIAAILDSAAGDIWLGTPNGLSTRSNGRWRVLRIADGLPSNDVNALMEDASGAIWVGTASGLAVVRDGRAQSLAAAHPRLHTPILGLAEDASGWFWIATTDGVYRVVRRALESGRVGDGDIRSFGTADGLLSVEGVKRHASLAVDPRGRVWLATTRGLAMADPARADAHAPPALVRIEGVSADGETLPVGSAVGVPAGRQRVTIDYAGLSLAVPERVRFRYRLDGFDRDWSAPVEAREAVYTNLGPGHYTFRVKASNGDGVWPDDEAVLGFEVAPTAWQTSWFRLSAALLCVAAAWGVYRLRLLQVARRMNERFDERLAERTRIAQELHDTLLQGFVSASMQLHVAADSLPAESPSKAAVGRVQELMARVIDEGRHAVRGLRSTAANAYDLERAFAGIPAELPAGGNPEYHVIVQGRPRPLAPLIRDDVYRIGREAVVNAFRHAAAGRVDLEIVFAPRELQLIVRDDGRGIDPGVVRSGTDGHWGLPGMRERAGRIGAQFKVSTRAGAGTEVALVVPGQVAFADETVRRGGWVSRFRRPASRGNAERRSDDGTEAQP